MGAFMTKDGSFFVMDQAFLVMEMASKLEKNPAFFQKTSGFEQGWVICGRDHRAAMSPLAQSLIGQRNGELSGGGRESAGQRTAQRASPYLVLGNSTPGRKGARTPSAILNPPSPPFWLRLRVLATLR
jgi:hypothetical protein